MIPPLPPARGEDQDGGVAELLPRYEDIAQDGRLQITSLMPGLGASVFRGLLQKMPALLRFRSQGILPILSRLVLMGDDRPVSVSSPIRYRGSFRFARELGGERLFLNMWVEASAPVGTTLGPDPEPHAPLERIGRIFAEHVITRPFAPPGQRRVTRLEAPGVPPIPEDEHAFESAEDLLADEPLLDAGTTTFGLLHTDSNQHVNSMVYPRMFEEAAVRQMMMQDARIAGAKGLLARAVELRFRRPFFVGDRATLAMRRIAEGEVDPRWRVGMIGAFGSAGEVGKVGKPSTAVKMWFR